MPPKSGRGPRQALGALVFDVVVAAPDRDDLGLMIFPPPGRAIDAAYRDELRTALQKMNERHQRLVARRSLAPSC